MATKRRAKKRVAPHVRAFLGQRLRELRTQRGFSQERLGNSAHLSGKFIGEVERGEKSISIDSLYRISASLAIPLRHLADVRRVTVPSEDAEKIFALVSARHPAAKLRRAHDMLRAMLDGRA